MPLPVRPHEYVRREGGPEDVGVGSRDVGVPSGVTDPTPHGPRDAGEDTFVLPVLLEVLERAAACHPPPMRWRPFSKPLKGLGPSDFEGLISPEPIPEGLFVEYKRDWQPKKVARAVASFANSPGGGTVIVGIEAEKLEPRSVVGVEMNAGELEEAAVHAIRSSVAPTPDFRLRAIPCGDDRSCLVVEVPEGTQPPYLLIRTGQILERTQTSSEPVPVHNRATLDRLFGRGERGRRWALEEAERLIRELGDAPTTGGLWTIPAVEGGLGANAIVFGQSTYERVLELARAPYHLPLREHSHRVRTDLVEHSVRGLSEGSRLSAQVQTTGVIRSLMELAQGGPGQSTLMSLARELLPRHSEMLEDVLGHRGDVVVGAFSRWRGEDGNYTKVRVIRGPEPLRHLDSAEFLAAFNREISRSLGHAEFEPEGE